MGGRAIVLKSASCMYEWRKHLPMRAMGGVVMLGLNCQYVPTADLVGLCTAVRLCMCVGNKRCGRWGRKYRYGWVGTCVVHCLVYVSGFVHGWARGCGEGLFVHR